MRRARIQPLAAASLYASIALTRILAWSTIGITYPSSLIFFSDNVADGLWTPVVHNRSSRKPLRHQSSDLDKE